MKIVVLDGYVANPGDLSWAELEALGQVVVYERTAPEQVVERCRGAVAVFTNKVVLGAAEIAALPELRFIGVLATGYNNIDMAAARAAAITVCNVPGYSSESVAQTVFALLLHITNRVADYNREVVAGRWASCADFSFTLGPITELSGLTMGIYGFGTIGRQVAAIASALGMRVISPTNKPADSLPDYVEKVTFGQMLETADVISINSAMTDANRGIFNAEAFGRIKPGVIVINTARGPLIDEQALADALRAGRVRAAGLDVLCQEPPRDGSPLIGAPNCFITPHIAWQSTAARRRLLAISAANLRAFIAGNPQNVVN